MSQAKKPLRCPSRGCRNADSTDDNNFRGQANPKGGELVFCKACGTEINTGMKLLGKPPERPINRGDATNLPDTIDEDKE